MNIADILGYIDSLKRQYGGTLSDIAANPKQGLLGVGDKLNQGAREWNRDMMGQMGGLLSVRPEVQEQSMEGLLGTLPMPGGVTKPGTFKVFHGSHGDVAGPLTPNAPKTTAGGFNKYGVSVSDNPSVASRYAGDFHQSPTVYPLSVKVDKPLNLTARDFEKLQTLVSKIDAGKPLTELEDVGLEMLLKKYGIAYGEHPMSAIKKSGFDVINKDAGSYGIAERETLVLDPEKLRYLFTQGEK